MYGQRLRELRKKHKKTQAEIGKLLGTDQSGYSKIENDIHSLPISLLGTLANYYGISIDELLEHEPANPKTDKEKAIDILREYEIAYKNDNRVFISLVTFIIQYNPYNPQVKNDNMTEITMLLFLTILLLCLPSVNINFILPQVFFLLLILTAKRVKIKSTIHLLNHHFTSIIIPELHAS